MKYFWILKYILYKVYSARDPESGYLESKASGVLLVLPFLSFYLLSDVGQNILLIGLGGYTLLFIFLEFGLSDEYYKYRDIEVNRENLNLEFLLVKLFIVLDFVVFVAACTYVFLMRNSKPVL